MLTQLREKFNKYLLTREYLYRAIIIVGTFAVFFGLDFLSKWTFFTFDPNKQGIGVSYGIIGIRSLPHANTTLISFLKFNFNPLFFAFFGTALSFILFFIAIWIKRKWLVFWIIMIMGGIMGNAVDFFRFGYVQDIIYFPWADRGTFNLADVIIIIGTIGLVITIVINELIMNKEQENII